MNCWWYWLMEMTGQVSIGKEYWSVIGPKRVTQKSEAPALVQGWAFLLAPKWLLELLAWTTVLSDLGLSHPPYQFDVQMFCVQRKQSLLGTPRRWASVLIETGFERLFSLSNVGFWTIRTFKLKSIDEVGLLVSSWLIFNVNKSSAKFVHWFKASRYTTGLKGIFTRSEIQCSRPYGMVNTRVPRLLVSEVWLMVAVTLESLFDFLACSNAQLGSRSSPKLL